MTKATGTMRLVFILTMAGGSIVTAQQMMAANATAAVPGLELQTNVSVTHGAQVKDDIFADTEKFANGASRVTEINLDPSTMGLMGDAHGRNADLAHKMKVMVVHEYAYDKPGMYRMEDVDAYRKKLEDGSWSCSIHVRSQNGSTDICSRTSSDHETNEMVLLSANPQKLTFIHMSGNMSLNDLTEMSGSANGLNRRVSPPEPPKLRTSPPGPPATPQAPH